MGVNIAVNDRTFTPKNSLGKIIPASSGLQYLFFGGDDVSLNQVLNGKSGLVSGSPASVTAYSSDMSESGYVNTGVACGASGTYILLFRVYSQPSDNNTVIGVWPYSKGVSIMFDNLVIHNWMVTANGTKSINITHGSKETDFTKGTWIALSLRWNTDSTNTTTLKSDILGKPSSSQTVVGATGQPVAQTTAQDHPVLIGSGYTSGTTGAGHKEVAFTGIWNRSLADSELNDVYAYLKTYYSKRGLTI